MKTKKIFIPILLLILLICCEKSLEVPRVISDKSTYSTGEQIEFWVKVYDYSDGTKFIPEYYSWYIENSIGDIIKDDFNDTTNIFWTPDSTGFYIVNVEIGYETNHRVTSIKEITVN